MSIASRLAVLTFVAFGASAQDAPARPDGKLVIVGGGEIGVGIATRFFDFAGGASARIVVIPTASKRADADDAEDRYLERWRAFEPAALELVHVADRDEERLAAAAAAIDRASAVWIGGGSQSRLVEAYRDTPVHAALRGLLARGGVVGGTSAGAACLSDPMIARGRDDAVVAPGLGLLRGIVIDQHFSERGRLRRLRAMIAEHRHLVGIGIDESTALEVVGRRATVVGAGHVTVHLAGGDGRFEGTTEHRASNVLDLPTLRRAARRRAQGVEVPAPAALQKGAVAICGGGVPDVVTLANFFARAGGSNDAADIVVITSASARPDTAGAELVEAMGAAGMRADRVVHTAADVRAALADATGAWLVGSRPWQLVDLDDEIGLGELLRALLARDGAVGASSSAANVLGSVLMRGHPLDDTIPIAEGYDRGFDLLPGVAVQPHCGERGYGASLGAVVVDRPPLIGLGIDEDTSVFLWHGHVQVSGAGQVTCVRSWIDRQDVARIALSKGDVLDFIRWAPR